MKKLKIAIMGSHLPNNGPVPEGYIKWGFNRQIKEADFWFDVHKRTCKNLTLNSEYGRFLKEKGKNVFLTHDNPNLPEAQHFPWEQLKNKHQALFTNSVDWLLAYAISLKPEIILLYGITIHPESNHGFCRRGNEYFIGFAQGQGIEVKIPGTSWLCHPEYITKEYFIGLMNGKGVEIGLINDSLLLQKNNLYGII